jgi:excinuclease ABC subunit C
LKSKLAVKRPLNNGVSVIQAYVKTLTESPGVYRMISKDGEVLYVGKAKNLKKRVGNYTTPERVTQRIQRMISLTDSMEFILTHTETEALLLEANLIKKLKPRFNVLLKDDKSFPYILLIEDHEAPKIVKYRGAPALKKGYTYFGPFASTKAVNETLEILIRIFRLRTCTDSVYANRSRPCLLYHIKKCSGPCAEKISQEEYAKNVKRAKDFLMGRTTKLQQEFAAEMNDASHHQQYEKAALYRDRIRALTTIQSQQTLQIAGFGSGDLFAGYQESGKTCIQVFFFRHGTHYGNKSYFPSHDVEESLEDVLSSFIPQFYENKVPPAKILLSHSVQERKLMEDALSLKVGSKVQIQVPLIGPKFQLVKNAVGNAREALKRKLAHQLSEKKMLESLASYFHLPKVPERIEVYDNSHIQGGYPYGVMIVAGPEGFEKKSYRKFSIKSQEIEPGDDYGMMREVLTRRLKGSESAKLPDLIILDGGVGQLNIGVSVLKELGLESLPIIAIAKGPNRNAGCEKIFIPGSPAFEFEKDDPLLYYLQRLRDESHRFAIGTHRAGRQRGVEKSHLDNIPGIGPKRKKALLHYFGSVKDIFAAGIKDLEKVEGINKETALIIYQYFHPEGALDERLFKKKGT